MHHLYGDRMSKRQSHLKRRRPFHPLDSITWTPGNLAVAYGLPTNLPGGGAVAIVEFGGGTYSGDNPAAAQLNGYTAPALTDVNAGLTNSPGSDADGECALDYQVAGGVYSKMTNGKSLDVYMIWANSDDSALAAIGKLINSGVNIRAVSISWGTDESDMESAAAQSEAASYLAFYQKYQIPILVSSGDNDDGAGGSTVSAPACYPFVLSVSGTTKFTNTESVWNSGRGEGTGGGESKFFTLPGYQSGVYPAPATGKMRVTGDISSVADPNTGFIVITAGQQGVVGGTSAAAPFIAGMFAAMNLPTFDIVTALYNVRSALTPIQAGNNNPSGNGLWPGAICCGLGVPGPGLYNALVAASGSTPTTPPTTVPPVSPPVSPPSPPVPVSETGTLTLTSFALTVPGILGSKTETVSGSGSATFAYMPATNVGPSPNVLATHVGAYRPRSMTWQQWLQLITAILTIINGIINKGGTAPPTAADIAAAYVATHPAPASMTGQQWLALILQILTVILPIILGATGG